MFLLAWVPDLARASLISHAPDRFAAWGAVVADLPPPPYAAGPLLPLLFAAMLILGSRPPARVLSLLAATMGAIVLTDAATAATDFFPLPPGQAFEGLRSGAFGPAGAAASTAAWAALWVAPFVFPALALTLYLVRWPAPGPRHGDTAGGAATGFGGPPPSTSD